MTVRHKQVEFDPEHHLSQAECDALRGHSLRGPTRMRLWPTGCGGHARLRLMRRWRSASWRPSPITDAARKGEARPPIGIDVVVVPQTPACWAGDR